MNKLDKQLDALVEHLIKTTVSEISDKLPKIVKETVYKQMEQVYKTQVDMQNDFGKFRDELKDFDKRMSDMQIQLDTVDSRTQQMKVVQDRQSRTIEHHVNRAVESAVTEHVPTAIESTLEPKKKKFKLVEKPSFFSKLRRKKGS